MATSENTLKTGMEDLKIQDSKKASMNEGRTECPGHWGKAWRHCHRNSESDCENRKCHKQKWMKMMSECVQRPWCRSDGCGKVLPQYYSAGFMQGPGRHHPGMWFMRPPAYQPQFVSPFMAYSGPAYNQFEGDVPTLTQRRFWFYPGCMYPADVKKFRKHCCKKVAKHSSEHNEAEDSSKCDVASPMKNLHHFRPHTAEYQCKSSMDSQNECENIEKTAKATSPGELPSSCPNSQSKDDRKRNRIMHNIMAMNMMQSAFPNGSVYGLHPGYWYGCNRKNWRRYMADSSTSSSSSDEDLAKETHNDKPMEN